MSMEFREITYDAAADALYIHLVVAEPTEQREYSENIILDFDVLGRLVGVEILHAGEGFDLAPVIRDFGLDPELLKIIPKVLQLIPEAHRELVLR